MIMSDEEMERLKEKLENSGVKEVKDKLARGIYGPHKVQFIKNWIQNQELIEADSRQKKINYIRKIGIIIPVIALFVTVVIEFFK